MEQETKKCPHCGKEILAVALKCKYCGEWLTGESASKKMIPCPVCGEKIEEDTDVCPHCGETLLKESSPIAAQPITTIPSNTQSQVEKSQVNKKKGSFLSVVILAVVVVIALLGIVITSMHTSNDNSNNVDSLSASEIEAANNAASDVTETQWTHWEKGYFKNDYGEDDTSEPYIKQEFNGESDRGECQLEINISNAYGIIFSISGRYVDFVNCSVKAKTANQEYILHPTSTNESSIIFQAGTEIKKILSLLECGDFFKLAINNSDAANQQSNFVFEICGKTNVRQAISEIETGQPDNNDQMEENAGDENNYEEWSTDN